MGFLGKLESMKQKAHFRDLITLNISSSVKCYKMWNLIKGRNISFAFSSDTMGSILNVNIR